MSPPVAVNSEIIIFLENNGFINEFKFPMFEHTAADRQ